jgi:hypothetical protein
MNLPPIELPPLPQHGQIWHPVLLRFVTDWSDERVQAYARLAVEQDRARRARLAVAWVHGFEHRFNKDGFRAAVSFVHQDHWTDEYWKPLYL